MKSMLLWTSQHRPVHRAGQGDECANSVCANHAQQKDDEYRARALWRDDAGAGRFELVSVRFGAA